MLFYPFLEGYFNLVIALPNFLWAVALIGLFLLGVFGYRDFRNALATILGTPILLYLVCYGCKAIGEIPLLGIFGFLIRLSIDITIIGGIIMAIKYYSIGKSK